MEMLVWQLRRYGDKLPKESLDGPHLGWLRLAPCTVAGEKSLHAGLHAGPSPGAPPFLPGLSHVEVRRLDERGMLLLGRQADPQSSRMDAFVPQAWFCKPVPATA